jgi:arabinan endo-1,5-alpha-L-arabinosidase
MGKVGSAMLAAAVALAAGPASAGQQAAQPPALFADRMRGDLTPVHDPAIISDGDTFYVFSTSQEGQAPGLIHIRTSKDLVTWTRAGAVFSAIPEWAKREVPKSKGIWAPDIVFVNGEYRLYYAVSTFGENHSAIGLATTKTLDPARPGHGWTDQGAVIVSNRTDDYNAIDPAAFVDRDGKAWLAFGSFWSGLKMIRLDAATGKPSAEDRTVRSLARRPAPGAVEAPFLIDHGGYYYLFASYDFCCRGADSSYYTVVGRSKDVTGPYLDHDGKPMTKGFGQIVLHGKLDASQRWRGPGGISILRESGRELIAWHAYDATNKGAATLRIAPILWTGDGWPVVRQ